MDTYMMRRASLFLAGAIVGGISGYLVGTLVANQIQKRKEEEADFREYEDTTEQYLKPVSELAEEETEVKEDNGNKNWQKNIKPTDYTKFLKPSLDDAAAPYRRSSIDPEGNGIKSPDKKLNAGPYIITEEEYASERPDYDRKLISYYEDDMTYADENEDIIDDANRMLGANLHLHFGEGNDDPDTVYVRNDRVSTIYEVSRIHNSYAVSVMGEAPKPKPTRGKRKASKKINDEEGSEE